MSRRSRHESAPTSVVIPFLLTTLCAAGFATSYVLGLGTEVLGATLGGAFAFLALGLAMWSRLIDAGEPEYVEERDLGPTPKRDYEAFHAALVDQPVPRSGVLWGLLGLSMSSIGAAALFPLRSLFPRDEPGPERAPQHDEVALGGTGRHGDRRAAQAGGPGGRQHRDRLPDGR